MNERFSASDLEPSAEDKRAGLEERIDRVAVVLAVLAVGVVLGGMVALGACAAPFVFKLTPAPSNGTAMGAAFARFDRLALACSLIVLAAEGTRTYLARLRPRRAAARIRRLLAIAFAACIAYVGFSITPSILSLHEKQVIRGVGSEGEQLDALHRHAETLGAAELGLGALIIALHVFTIRARSEDDDPEYEAPIPPGSV